MIANADKTFFSIKTPADYMSDISSDLYNIIWNYSINNAVYFATHALMAREISKETMMHSFQDFHFVFRNKISNINTKHALFLIKYSYGKKSNI